MAFRCVSHGYKGSHGFGARGPFSVAVTTNSNSVSNPMGGRLRFCCWLVEIRVLIVDYMGRWRDSS